MHRAYTAVFTRCGLDFTVVEAESGPIGGSASHEFMVNAESGEDDPPLPGERLRGQRREVRDRPAPRGAFDEPPPETGPDSTPNLPGIEVGKFMKVKPDRMLKTIVFEDRSGEASAQDAPAAAAPPKRWIVAIVRGDHDVNEGKVKALSGASKIALADPASAKVAGFAVGYVSPRVLNSVPGVLLLVDADASLGGFWATGADKPDHHVKHFNWRDVGDALTTPAVSWSATSATRRWGSLPRAPGAALVAQRGIEVGHIFKLGDKYSKAMGFLIPDETQQRRPVIMGCYGIGVSRTVAACVEQRHDEAGIIWPAPIAPYHVEIVLMKPDDSDHMGAAHRLAADLADAGIDVLIDDRHERPGVKFNDADLIGMPIRATVGAKALEQGGVELKARTDPGKGEVVPLDQAASWCLRTLNV